jgi:hypothetical protein
MLRLPRRECTYKHISPSPKRYAAHRPSKRHRLTTRNPSTLPNAAHATILLRLRRTHDAARRDSRERMDSRSADARILRSRPAALSHERKRRRRSTVAVIIGHQYARARRIADPIIPPRARLPALPVLGTRRGVPHGHCAPARPWHAHGPAMSS